MKTLSYLLFIASFLILLIALTGMFISNKILQEETFYASVEISSDKGLGFDVSPTALTFGRISASGSSTRNVFFENGYDFPVLVKIEVDGDIRPLIQFDEVIRVESGENATIPFSVYAFENSTNGFYDGDARLVVKLAR